MDVRKLEAEALGLEPAERARLAERLFESLTSDTGAETDHLWIEEALARDEELDSGAVQAILADEVLRNARARLG